MHRISKEHEHKILNENSRIAERLRAHFAEHGILCLNIISAPGAGKTTLLERTLEALPRETRVAVITADIQTDNDALRLARFGFPVKHITTGGACHLEAPMIERVLEDLDHDDLDLLLIENVGNLVCPASYDLGEAAKIVVLSCAEGDDKPLKYPAIFFKAELLVLTKTDLLPYVQFDIDAAERNAHRQRKGLEVVRVSAISGAGIAPWLQWLERKRHAVRVEAAVD
ncbi:MAG: hydrogenase nickel incorporation protein HypB [Candidatus Binatia bacterium]|jgi:hydrogenase nickel incorporation protein HypB